MLSAVPGVNQSEHTHPAEGGKNGDHSLGSNASKDSVVVRFREPLAQRVIEGACQERSVSVLCLDLKDELTSLRFTSVAAWYQEELACLISARQTQLPCSPI